jgi:hypothetical protein
MNKDEALKLALEAHQAMREWIDAVPDDTVLPAMPGCDRDWLDTVEAALKQALAAPTVQEPVAWLVNGSMVVQEDWIERLHWPFEYVAVRRAIPDSWTPILYTTPPAEQRQWVGLTDYEIGVCSTEAAMNRSEMVGGAVTFARVIEAKLKEKNT